MTYASNQLFSSNLTVTISCAHPSATAKAICSVNEELKAFCIHACNEEGLDEPNPAMAIIVKIWKKLKEDHWLGS